MEIWDLMDAQRCPTGETAVRGTALPQGRYHLVVNVVIFNSKDEMLIQQRHEHKDTYPGLWDISAAGSALAGEDSHQAAVRETKEEIGVDIDLTGVPAALSFAHRHSIQDVYILRRELDPAVLQLQETEVQAVRWASREEVLAMLEAGTFVPYAPSALKLLFELLYGLVRTPQASR